MTVLVGSGFAFDTMDSIPASFFVQASNILVNMLNPHHVANGPRRFRGHVESYCIIGHGSCFGHLTC